MQRTTKNNRPIIHKYTKLPLYRNSVDYRIKNITKELYKGLTSNEARWLSIKNTLNSI